MQLGVLRDNRDLLGEGPFWDAAEQALYWVDIVGRVAKRLDTRTGALRRWEMPDFCSAIIPRRRGGAVVALRGGLAFLELSTGAIVPFCSPDASEPSNRSNEARCDSRGRLWLGTMQNNLSETGGPVEIVRAAGSLFRVEADGSYTAAVKNVGISNTLAWAPDDKLLYFADTLANRIDRFDFDVVTGEVSKRRAFAMHERGLPDGSAMDAEGRLWNARWGGGCLLRFAQDGSVDRVTELPLVNPTSCVFGGPNLDILFVTSASHGLSADRTSEDPDGKVLALDVGVAGMPCHKFAG